MNGLILLHTMHGDSLINVNQILHGYVYSEANTSIVRLTFMNSNTVHLHFSSQEIAERALVNLFREAVNLRDEAKA